jgi:hypothetical protein
MNIPETEQNPNTAAAGSKRPYSVPELKAFGRLAALTQSASGCNMDDSSGCVVGSNNNMGPMTSDMRAKENVIAIGEHPLGFGLYLFNYKPEFREQWGHGRQFGVMAQEVEAVLPEAVIEHPDGYKMVDYEMLGITRFAH